MSANNDYKFSQNVYSGDDVRAVARASRITGLQNISRSQSNGDQYSRASSGSRAIGPGWVVNRSPRRLHISGRRKRRPLELYPTSKDGQVALGVTYGTVGGLTPVQMVDIDTGEYKDAIFINPVTGANHTGVLIATVTVTAGLSMGIPSEANLIPSTVNPAQSETTVSVQVGSYTINPTTHAMTVFQAASGSLSLIISGATVDNGDTFLLAYWSAI